jgi:hypothetical protein
LLRHDKLRGDFTPQWRHSFAYESTISRWLNFPRLNLFFRLASLLHRGKNIAFGYAAAFASARDFLSFDMFFFNNASNRR